MSQRTLSIIKPDATERNLEGTILEMIQENNLRVIALKKIRMTKEEAQGFYAVHQDKPFFDSLTDYMSSGPIVVSILEGEDAIEKYRRIMGATDPGKAEEGTVRNLYGQDIEKNSVHGSDSPQTAAQEIPYFFNQLEMVG